MLIQELQAKDKKGLFRSNDNFVNYSTGLLPLDYANGFWMTQVDPDTGEVLREPIPGVLGGKFILLFGTTGSGKTTLAIQLGYRIIKEFEDGILMLVDCEQTALKERMCAITNLDQDDPRLVLNVDNTSIEDVLSIVNDICTLKEDGGKQYMYEVKDRSFHKESFWAYVPTVIVIDSLRQFNPKNKDIVTLGNNMDNAREAQFIARFLDNVINRINKYNITIIYTNHIQPKIEANPYAQPPRGLMLSSQTETLPRGTRPLFLAHTAIRANAVKSNMYTKEDVGFDGFMVTLLLAKSKTNFIGATINVAFNASKGFDPIYTMFEFAKQCGIVQGKNPNLYIEGMDDMKFSRKNFSQKMIENPEFNRRFMQVIQPYLEALLGAKEVSEDDRVQYGDYASLADENEQH
jgi:archaellum biogenesis ATPase FlaH